MTESEPRDRSAVIMPGNAPSAIEWAAEQLVAGGVIAFPTDTAYVIAAALSHRDAVRRIFEIEGRHEANPLHVLVSTPNAIVHLAIAGDENLELLLDRFWPGPLTLVVPAKSGMPAEVTAADGTVGLRMPNHPLAIEIIAKAGGAVACTTAHRSGRPSATNAREVVAEHGHLVDLVVDGGRSQGGVALTVARLVGKDLAILSDGAIPAEVLLAEWHELRTGCRE